MPAARSSTVPAATSMAPAMSCWIVSDSRITNNSGAYIEAGDDLALAVVTGQTISGGAISGGTKVANGYILNSQGYFTAGDDISAATGNFYNMRNVTVGGSGPYTFTSG